MSTVAWIGLLVLSAVAMEPLSAMVHRFIGHGIAWPLHRSHHEGPVRGPERNDVIPAVSAVVTMLLFALGTWSIPWLLPIACGFTVYGIGYFVIHDLYIHRRIDLLPEQVRLFEPLKQAHMEHHGTGTGSWGLFAPVLTGCFRSFRQLLGRRTGVRI